MPYDYREIIGMCLTLGFKYIIIFYKKNIIILGNY